MNKLVKIVVLAVMPFMVASCTSTFFGGKKKKKKDTVTAQPVANKTTPEPVVTGVPVPTAASRRVIDLVTPLWNKRLAYKTFSGKAKIDFDGPKGNVGFSANFRIAKDSLIWVHVSALGGLYSVARILVTPDSFFMINYDQKEVTYLPLADAVKILPVAVQFSQLQNLFLGEPLANGVITNAEEKDTVWNLRTEDTSYVQHITYQKKGSLMVFGDLQTRKPNGPQAMIDYNNYEAVGTRKLSTKRMVHIQNGLNNYTLDMDFINPEFDKQLEYPFSLPKNYTVKNQ